MKTCSYCGRENEDGQATCPGCGTDFRPRRVQAEVKGVLDPITPPRRCDCGGVMRYYTPTPGSSTFFRPFRYRYVCGACGHRAIVTPYDQRPVLVPLFVAGCVAAVCLYFSHPLEGLQRGFKTRWVVIGILVAAAGLTAGWLALLGARNRRRYPIIDDSPEDADPSPSSPSQMKP